VISKLISKAVGPKYERSIKEISVKRDVREGTWGGGSIGYQGVFH
jgi:hypothetical protein